jgi:hypothetical protein
VVRPAPWRRRAPLDLLGQSIPSGQSVPRVQSIRSAQSLPLVQPVRSDPWNREDRRSPSRQSDQSDRIQVHRVPSRLSARPIPAPPSIPSAPMVPSLRHDHRRPQVPLIQSHRWSPSPLPGRSAPLHPALHPHPSAPALHLHPLAPPAPADRAEALDRYLPHTPQATERRPSRV